MRDGRRANLSVPGAPPQCADQRRRPVRAVLQRTPVKETQVPALPGAAGNHDLDTPGWSAYQWGSFESGNPNECYERPVSVFTNALLEALAGDVHYREVSFSDRSAEFNSFNYTTTLDIGSATGGSAACAGGSNVFTIVVEFDMPIGADSIKHPDARTFVSDADNQQFQYLDFGFQNVSFSTRRGEMWIQLRRARRTAVSNRVSFTITGTYSNQTGVWGGRGRVSLVCPS